MTGGDAWLENLLWPTRFAPAPNEGPDVIADRDAVVLLLLGRLADVDACMRFMGVNGGLHGLVEGHLQDSHPVSTALAGWLSRFGRSDDEAAELAALPAQLHGEQRTVATVLAAVALSTAHRLSDAVNLLRKEARSQSGLGLAILQVQLSCRELERGETAIAIDLAAAVADGAEPSIPAELVMVARSNRFNADPIDGPEDLIELQRLPTGEAAAASARQRSSGLNALLDDTATQLLASAANPPNRVRNWDRGWQQLLGAWLQTETWGDWGAIRSSRRLLGLYPTVEMALPAAADWSRTTADTVEIDLLRRSGDDRLVQAVASRWWEEGPLDELQTSLGRLRGSWPPYVEMANLALLSAAGDLLSTEDADGLLAHVAGMLHDDALRSFAPAFYVGPAMIEALQPASDVGLHVVAQAVLRSVDRVNARPMTAVVRSLSERGVPASVIEEFVASAADLIATEEVELQALGIEMLLAVAHRPGGSEGRIDQRRVETLLLDAWRRSPSLVFATGLVRLPAGEAVRAELVVGVTAQLRSGARQEGWISARQLLAVLADDASAAAEVGRWLADDTVSIQSKGGVLAQLATHASHASSVLDETSSAALRESVDALALEPEPFGSSPSLRATVWSACARAQTVDADSALRWILDMLSGGRHERWAAAHALGAMSVSLEEDDAVSIGLVLMADPDVQIASEAAAQLQPWLSGPEAWPTKDRSRARLADRLLALAERPGSLGPLTAGRVLLSAGLDPPHLRRSLADHASARTRAVAAYVPLRSAPPSP